MTGLVAQVASYSSSTLEFTELLRAVHSFTIVCENRLHASGLDFIDLWSGQVIRTPDSGHLDG